jgi:HAD superfamily phosphatase (TIGR01668 family)
MRALGEDVRACPCLLEWGADISWDHALLKAIIFDLGNTLIRQDDGRAFPHAAEVLTRLKNKYKLAIISNVLPITTADVVHELLREAKLFDFFDMIAVSSEVGVSKPDPRIFETVLAELNVKPEEAAMIGNTISTDIFGGNAIGMRTVLFQLGQEYQRSEWEIPDHTIHSLKELLELV